MYIPHGWGFQSPKKQVPGFGERAARSLARCAAAENFFIRAVG